MSSESDDALTWDGDDGAPPRRPALPTGWNAVGKGSEDVAKIEDAAPSVSPSVATQHEEDAPSMGTGLLLALGVVGGVYLLYTVGWVVGGLRLRPLASFLVDDSMFLPWFVLAIAAPALWMLTVLILTRGRAAWLRVMLLVLGAILLVPWPFVTVGVIGS